MGNQAPWVLNLLHISAMVQPVNGSLECSASIIIKSASTFEFSSVKMLPNFTLLTIPHCYNHHFHYTLSRCPHFHMSSSFLGSNQLHHLTLRMAPQMNWVSFHTIPSGFPWTNRLFFVGYYLLIFSCISNINITKISGNRWLLQSLYSWAHFLKGLGLPFLSSSLRDRALTWCFTSLISDAGTLTSIYTNLKIIKLLPKGCERIPSIFTLKVSSSHPYKLPKVTL